MSESSAKSVPACSSLIALNGQPAPCAHAQESNAVGVLQHCRAMPAFFILNVCRLLVA